MKEKSLKERFILYNALSSATEKLYLSYCVSGQGDEKRTKSEGITLTEKIIPHIRRISTAEESLVDLIESEKSAFRLMAERYRSQDRESNTLYSYFGDNPQYGGVLYSMSKAIYKEPYEITQKDTALKLFGEDLYF
ncbi:MAG: hypothetical protein IKV21_00065, partial [Clostridia bacterium]|nr:hypothetical protein [Clostridia bacterium]